MLTPTLTSAPGPTGVRSVNGGAVEPHHGLVALVLFSALVLVILDKAGFKFVVTTGKR